MPTVTTDKLRLGDVVTTYGMRVLLDREPIRTYDRRTGLTRYAWVGTVLNAEEATCDHGIPPGFLRSGGRHPVWNVQGNKLADWSVERVRG